jgi:clan AA aspartic protease (TIGR02281 family)
MGAYAVSLQQPHEILMPALEPTTKHLTAVTPAATSEAKIYNSERVTIPLKSDDRALLLNATIDHEKQVSFILDTGATYTTISRETATALGYDLVNTPKVTITTANGRMLLPKVLLKSVTLNGYTAKNVEATVMNMPKDVPFNGLLGLTFIKRHRITIDSQADHLVIEPQQPI